MTFRDLEWRRQMASLVLRPFDMLRHATGRPPYEQRPVYSVHLLMSGVVTDDEWAPFGHDPPVAVRNLSGDTVFRDLDLPSGRYRIAIDSDTGQRGDWFYESLDPDDRDIDWERTGAFRMEVEGRPHPSKLHRVPLYPTGPYPFPPESTLLRGSLLWYDGSALEGAIVRDAAPDGERTTLIGRSRVGPRGNFVLVRHNDPQPNAIEVVLDLDSVDPSAKEDGIDYISRFPASIPGVQWRRGGTVSVAHAALRGIVRRSDGRPAHRATVSVAGWPGAVGADERGRWQYHFPPKAQALQDTVDITFRAEDHLDRTLNDVPVVTDATTQVVTVRLTAS